jgi:membrane-bound lytic murein transglycosylase D
MSSSCHKGYPVPCATLGLFAAALLALGGCSTEESAESAGPAVMGVPAAEAAVASDGPAALADKAQPGKGDGDKDQKDLKDKDKDKDKDKEKDEVATEEEIDSAIASVDDKIEEEDIGAAAKANVGDEISHATSEKIPLEINEDVERWIDYFTVKDRERFQRFLERGEKWKGQVMAVLTDQGIPTEIFYQAMIESGFACGATSHASAVGIWQFIRGTGRRYGLRVDSYVDERRDPLRSTIAASLYLKDLYNVFQSWYLAMAAYNAGEGRIMNAIMRAKTRDFWEMVKKHELPSETMNYIPKFLAATIIGHSPRKYGFDDLKPEMMPALVSVSVPSPVKLSDIASITGIPLQTLKDENPNLLRGITPPGVSTYRIWVPKDQADAVEGETDRLAAMRIRGMRSVGAVAAAGRPRYHVVEPGDTLAKVAGMYGLSVRQLKRLNHLHSGKLAPGTRLALGGSGKGGGQQASKRYRVKRGDNLEGIARRFGLSVSDLKRLNRLKRNKLYIGQVLAIGGDQKG